MDFEDSLEDWANKIRASGLTLVDYQKPVVKTRTLVIGAYLRPPVSPHLA